jgi:mono/diheme cytochrome c family protein
MGTGTSVRRETQLEAHMKARRWIAGFALAGLSGVASAENVAQGKQVYAEQCVVCHGIRGKGNGPSGKGLNPKPTDFTTAVANDEEWFKATKLGTKAIGKSAGMEGFAAKLTDEQIRDVLAYVKTLKP